MGTSGYFYPRSPRGGRPLIDDMENIEREFLSTLSARRATQVRRDQWRVQVYFYPRSPRGGRREILASMQASKKFLSTLSARRATAGRNGNKPQVIISIHALREEGDITALFSRTSKIYFYPRSPRGGRRSTKTIQAPKKQFLSTLSARRATIWLETLYGMPRFLSTLSARRATAKTETKSLFSNKLYNILHEFRRALIYNGSKSYPNHAK